MTGAVKANQYTSVTAVACPPQTVIHNYKKGFMDSLLIAALTFSLSQILLSVILFIRIKRSWSVQQGLYGVFLLAVTGYLLTPLADNRWLSILMSGLQTLVPGTFWLFSASLFDDHFKLKARHWLLVSATVLLPVSGGVLTELFWQVPRWLFFTLPQALEFILMGLALWSVVGFWQDDLVESRRDLRLWFCGVIGLYIVTLLLLREVIFPGAAWLSVWQYVPVGAVLLLTNGLLLEHKTGLFHPPPASNRLLDPLVAMQGAALAEQDFGPLPDLPAQVDTSARATSPSVSQMVEDTAVAAEAASINTASSIHTAPSVKNNRDEDYGEVPEEVLKQLTLLMETECVYREMGLTIGQLAIRLELPEYRLRRMINAGLGYRNFNDFLNTYRIREASQRLIDPNDGDEAVLNIALDAGFRSLSSFNKAFKQSLGKTPTEYRAQHKVVS